MLFHELAKEMNKITKYQLRCSARILRALHPSKLNAPSVNSVALNNILQFLNYNHRLLDLEYSIQNDILNYSRHTHNNKSNKNLKRLKSEYLQEISNRMGCLELIGSCMDMNLIAKQLASSKVYFGICAQINALSITLLYFQLDKTLGIMKSLQPSIAQSMAEFENCGKNRKRLS